MGGESHRHVLLYDGVCALCNRTVRFLLRIDRHRRLAFAPLQGPTAEEILARHRLSTELRTLVLVLDHGRETESVRIRSDGALAAAVAAGGVWRLFGVLRLFPRPLRDWVYDRVATHRYRWFGRYDACPLPDPAVRDRFLP